MTSTTLARGHRNPTIALYTALRGHRCRHTVVRSMHPQSKIYQQDTLDKGVEMRFNLLHADWSPSIQSEDIEWFLQAVNCGDYSRYGLAVSLCERTNWRNKKGKLCAAQAGKILPVVADKLGVELPPVRFAKPQAGELPEYDKDVKLRCTLGRS